MPFSRISTTLLALTLASTVFSLPVDPPTHPVDLMVERTLLADSSLVTDFPNHLTKREQSVVKITFASFDEVRRRTKKSESKPQMPESESQSRELKECTKDQKAMSQSTIKELLGLAGVREKLGLSSPKYTFTSDNCYWYTEGPVHNADHFAYAYFNLEVTSGPGMAECKGASGCQGMAVVPLNKPKKLFMGKKSALRGTVKDSEGKKMIVGVMDDKVL